MRARIVRFLTLIVCLASLVASAAPFQRSQRLLISNGTLRGSPRLMALSGAYVAIAEGVEGLFRNPASVASKNEFIRSDFAIDFAGTMHFLFPGSTLQQDWDNDGFPEQKDGLVTNLGTQVFYGAVSFRYKNFGLGAGFDLQNFISSERRPGESFDRIFNVMWLHLSVSAAYAFWNDQILVGLGIETTHALFGYSEKPDGALLPPITDSEGYHGWGAQVGAVWRPENGNYRVGLSFLPNTTAFQAGKKDQLGGLSLPLNVATPGRLSIGYTVALGSGRPYNVTSDEHFVTVPGKFDVDGNPLKTAAMTKWLLTAQVDMLLPVENAVALAPVLEQPFTDAVPAGAMTSFLLRAAAEKEIYQDRLRLRLGTYLEPPISQTGPVLRPHLTFGFEMYLFRLGQQRLSFGLSFDFAHMYQNVSFGILPWK